MKAISLLLALAWVLFTPVGLLAVGFGGLGLLDLRLLFQELRSDGLQAWHALVVCVWAYSWPLILGLGWLAYRRESSRPKVDIFE